MLDKSLEVKTMLILSFVAKATGRKIAEVFDFQWLHLATSEDFLNNFVVKKEATSNDVASFDMA